MSHGTHDRPLARTEGVLLEEVGEETVVLDTTSGEVHCLSPLATAVYAGCDGSKAVDGLAEDAGSRLAEPVSAEQVETALAQLEERGLLALPPEAGNGFSRRALIQRTAVATAAVTAAPLITSIVTPAVAQSSPDERCPGGLCASQARGDDYCACNNDCPCITPGSGACDASNTATCQSFCLTAPYQDSCECLRCPAPKGGGGFDEFDFSGRMTLARSVCPAEWFTTTARPACGNSGLCNGGCENGKQIDGVCLRIDPQGDTSEPCPA